MGEDPWSQGENADPLTEDEARTFAAENGIDIDAPGPSPGDS